MTIRLLQCFLFLILSTSIIAEGTRETAPNANITVDGNTTNDIAALHLAADAFNNFALYDNPNPESRFHIHIADPGTETILLGFSNAHTNATSPTPPFTDFEYRIVDPNGNIVFGPIMVGSVETGQGIINSWSEGFNGPAQLGNANGYDARTVSSADLLSQGWTGAGDYYIEFQSIVADGFLIDFWDVTVVDTAGNGMTEKKGRIWANNWAFFAINDFGFPNRPFNGSFFVCAPDPAEPDAAFITRIDFNGSGFMPAAFVIAFNSFGVENTGDIMSDRRSFENGNMTESEYPIFLNDPVDICRTADVGELTFQGVSRCDLQDFCIKFTSTKAGQVDVLLDFDGQDDIFTPNTADVLIIINVDSDDINQSMCIDWDGVDGLGNEVFNSSGIEIPVSVSFAQGIYHFPIFDAELMLTGFDIENIRPAGPKPNLFYDDTEISTVSGSGEPNIQLAGCNLPCHSWTNYTTGATVGFGNLNTINSWWFSSQTITNEVFSIPAFLSCDVQGGTEFCEGEDGQLSLDIQTSPANASPLEITDISWTGPGIVGANNTEDINVNESGTYISNITYLSDNGDECTLSCSQEVTVLRDSEGTIDTTLNFGEIISINMIEYQDGGTFTQTLTAVNGCDSLLTIMIEVIFADIDLECTVTGPVGICSGGVAQLSVTTEHFPVDAPMPEIISIDWRGPGIISAPSGDNIDINLAGQYEANVTWLNQMGDREVSSCSFFIQEFRTGFSQIDTSFFLGESATFNGETFTQSGINEQILSTVQGCDSIITIVVNVTEPLYECFITGDRIICDNETAQLELNTLIIPPGSPIPPLTEINWTGPGFTGTGAIVSVTEAGPYSAVANWLNAIGEARSTSCTHDLDVIGSSSGAITIYIIEGDSITVNGENFFNEGLFTQNLISSNGCDSLLTINILEESIALNYDFEDCRSSDFSLLTSTTMSTLTCGTVSGNNVFRVNPNFNAHSCTPGINDDSVALCINPLDSCDYIAGDEKSLIFEIDITPVSGEEITLTGIDFYEQAPPTFEWIVGTTGRNNFPTLYGIRVLKDGVEIFRETDINTSFIWSRENFSFIEMDDFVTDVPTTFRFELLPYCPVGLDAPVSVWDIDELNIRAACNDDISLSNIRGKVVFQDNTQMENVEMIMQYGSLDNQYFTSHTDSNGEYAFNFLSTDRTYHLEPYKDDQHLNGVSTLDIIFIQKHILGQLYFDSPEQMIAADVNNTESITALDIIELRKLILGFRDDFPNNTSWRFSNSAKYLSLDSPWAIEETAVIKLKDENINIDFNSIKIGDVNNDLVITKSRTGQPIDMSYDINELDNGQYQIDFYTEDITQLQGLQLSFVGLSDVTELNSEFFYTDNHYNIVNGELKLSLYNTDLQNIKENQSLFTIITSKVDLDQALKLGSLSSQLYEGETLRIRPITLKSNTIKPTIITNQWTATPNPFSTETNIEYQSSVEGPHTFSFYNMNGQLIHTLNMNSAVGLYNIKLDNSILNNTTGIIFCVIKSEHHIESRKLLKLN